MQILSVETLLPKGLKSYLRGTVDLCRSRGCKSTSYQILKFEKKSAAQETNSTRTGQTQYWGDFDHPQSLTDHKFTAL